MEGITSLNGSVGIHPVGVWFCLGSNLPVRMRLDKSLSDSFIRKIFSLKRKVVPSNFHTVAILSTQPQHTQEKLLLVVLIAERRYTDSTEKSPILMCIAPEVVLKAHIQH